MRGLPRHPTRYFQDPQESLSEGWLAKQYDELEAVISDHQPDDTTWTRLVLHWDELQRHIGEHSTRIRVAFRQDVRDEEASQAVRSLDTDIAPVCTRRDAALRRAVLSSSARGALEARFGTHWWALLETQESCFHPDNVAHQTALSEVLRRYAQLMAKASFVGPDGDEHPLSMQRKLARDADPAVRRAGFSGYLGWFREAREELDGLFDEATRLRQTMANNLGLPHFVPLGYRQMRRVDYDASDVAGFRDALVRHVIPVLAKIRAAQAKRLGRQLVPLCDQSYHPDTAVSGLRVSVADQPAAMARAFHSLSPILGEHFDRLRSNELIDLEARPGKMPGAFCAYLPDSRAPFVFTNSVGASSDITTLAHEAGHSFQGWESREIELETIRWPGMEAAEVPSMGMEHLLFPHLHHFFDDEALRRYQRGHIRQGFERLGWMGLVDHFQHTIYEQGLDADGRAEAWAALEDRYQPGLDWSDTPDWKRYRWHRQGHIFRRPFYYIDYAIAQLGAWQLWLDSLDAPEETMERYLTFCRLGGTKGLTALFDESGLAAPFDEEAVQALVARVIAAVDPS